MAKVTVTVLGGQPELKEATTVGELAELLGLPSTHSVLINGVDGSMDDDLADYDFVAFGNKVEGGL